MLDVGNKLKPVKTVSVCVRGGSSKNQEQNTRKIKILKNIENKILNSSWENINCIVFPGGFFHLSSYVGDLSYIDRCKAVAEADFYEISIQVCTVLEQANPGILLFIGIDTIPKDKYGYDQLCVALSKNGIVGIGRKIFPTQEEGASYICYADDFSTHHRIVKLPSGRKAVLCACYDLFGIAETTSNVTKRTKNIRNIQSGRQLLELSKTANFKQIRNKCINEWSILLKEQQVNTGIATIHGFRKPGLDGFWQRHGIATASSALKEGLAIGASHFEDRLPAVGKSTLTSFCVEKSHLTSGLHRKTHRQPPNDKVFVNDAIVRLFIT